MPPTSSTQSATGEAAAEPVGAGEYMVQEGDCIHSIAFDHGLFWETLWNHPDNSAVKEARKNPSLLLAGDRLTIPPLRLKEEDGATDAKHSFRRKGVPGKLVIVLTRPPEAEEDEGSEGTDPDAEPNGESSDPEVPDPKPQEPWGGVAWKCTIDGVVTTGTTGDDGKIELVISPGAREGQLVVNADQPTQRVITLRLGHLDPPDTPRGIMQRLRGVGFDPGPGEPPGADDRAGQARLREAIESFQAAHGLDCTGQADAATIDKLKEVHGS